MMKNVENMSETEVFSLLDKGLRSYLSTIRPYGEYSLEDGIKAQRDELTLAFRLGRGLGWRGPMPEDTRKDLNLVLGHYEPRMMELALAAQTVYGRQSTLYKIKAVTARAILEPALEAAGYSPEIECQRYRAKVSLYLGDRRLCFYVGYKALERENTIPDLLVAIRDMGDAMNRIGGYIKVSR